MDCPEIPMTRSAPISSETPSKLFQRSGQSLRWIDLLNTLRWSSDRHHMIRKIHT